MQRVAIICLGALGDCCNALPIALHEFQQDNNVTFYIAREFASLLDGVTYCEREIWDGHYSECLKAAEHAWRSGLYDRIMVVQCYGTSIERQTDSYCKEAWRAVGKLNLWGKLPLAFDNRSEAREDVWKNAATADNSGRPILVVSHSGKSSPFKHSRELLELLVPLADKFIIFDISNLWCERFYDLLGLMEIATCLIATDSGPLHLANAVPKLPIIALITDRPDNWHGSPSQANHVLRIRYGEFEKSKGRIVETLNQIVSKEKIERRIIHAWNDYPYRQFDAQGRHEVAKRSWEEEYKRGRWIPCPVHDSQLTRNAQSIGEPKPLPFVNDIIEAAASQAQPDDYICLTNDDTIFVHGLTDLILDGPMQWSSRWEHVMVKEPLTPQTIQKNAWKHVGADIFVFTKRWWLEVHSEFPDMILAREAWDLVLRTLISLKGGQESIALCAHIIHQPEWHSPEHRESVSNLFNRDAARGFFRNHNMRWPSV
jgi:hypothetical protein